jgi:hypothetical protein
VRIGQRNIDRVNLRAAKLLPVRCDRHSSLSPGRSANSASPRPDPRSRRIFGGGGTLCFPAHRRTASSATTHHLGQRDSRAGALKRRDDLHLGITRQHAALQQSR